MGVNIFHTPGHIPDKIALYDHGKMMLYVGDSLYEYEPIIFPSDGSTVTWFESMVLVHGLPYLARGGNEY